MTDFVLDKWKRIDVYFGRCYNTEDHALVAVQEAMTVILEESKEKVDEIDYGNLGKETVDVTPEEQEENHRNLELYIQRMRAERKRKDEVKRREDEEKAKKELASRTMVRK